MGLNTVFDIWTHLREHYQPSSDVVSLSVIQQEHALQQGDSIVDDFYAHSSAIWHHLSSLRTTPCFLASVARCAVRLVSVCLRVLLSFLQGV